MRILLTTDTVGGVWTFTCELTANLLERGHAVALVSFGRAPSDAQTAWCARMSSSFGRAFLYRASEAPLEWMQDNGSAFGEGAELLVATAREFKAEILHANQFCWGALDLALPKLITAHSDVMSWAAACDPDVLHGSTWLARYCSLVQHGLDGADAVVAPTAWMRQALDAHFHVATEFDVIPNGRRVPDVLPAQCKLQAVSVGRLWDPAKALQTLLEIDAPMPVLVAGEEQFGEARSNTGNLRALGPLSEGELLRTFNESSVYVATSIYEPFGLAPLEAALCGCAVVARDIAPLREVWAEAALYFRTSAELETILRTLADNGAELAAAQAKAAARAAQFTADRMTSAYLETYETLIAEHTHAGVRQARELITHVA